MIISLTDLLDSLDTVLPPMWNRIFVLGPIGTIGISYSICDPIASNSSASEFRYASKGISVIVQILSSW